MARYRYIVGNIDPREPIELYGMRRTAKDAAKLLPGVGEISCRVHIPADMELEYKPRSGLYITKDTRTIAELGYDIFMNTWDGRQMLVKSDADITLLAEREKARWAFAMHEARRKAGMVDYVEEPCDVTVGEWFGGR